MRFVDHIVFLLVNNRIGINGKLIVIWHSKGLRNRYGRDE